MADYLAIYLNDHLAGATAGAALARRLAGRGDAYTELVGPIAREIEEDKQSLENLMGRLGIGRDRVKALVARAGVAGGRLKLNGHVLSLSPLSRMEELEMLSLGVEGKASLWRALGSALAADARIDADELDRLIERAESQRERIEHLRLRAAGETF